LHYIFSFIHSKKKRKSETSENKAGNISNFLSKPGSSKSPNLSRKDDGFLSYEELVYWQENFKLPNCEAGTTPQKSNRRSRRSSTDPPIKGLSLNEWMAWQNVPSPVFKITHSRRSEHLIEILEFIELHGVTGVGEDDAYDVEMMSFLNQEDLVSLEDDAAMIVVDDDDDDAGNTTENSRSKKTGKNQKKKKSISNESDAEGDKRKRNNMKQTKLKKSKNSKSISPQQKTKWREYLKGFENEDNDFDTGEKDANIPEAGKGEPLNPPKDCQNPNDDEVPQECLDVEPGNKFEIDTPRKEDDDAFEVSSQSFSQLLPSFTPQNAHAFRSRLTGIDTHAQEVPLPPSLDSLNEISPFTPNKRSGTFENQNMHENKMASCRRNISNCIEMVPGLDGECGRIFRKEVDLACGNNAINESGFTLETGPRKSDVVLEPPDLDLECGFGKEIHEDLEFENDRSKDLQKGFAMLSESHNTDIVHEAPDLDLENEFGDFSKDEEDLIFENTGSNDFDGKNLPVESETHKTPEPPDLMGFDESGDDVHDAVKTLPSKTKEIAGFGAGIVCESNTSDTFDDDIEIEFGDDSLADGLLADLDDEDIESVQINHGFANETVRRFEGENKDNVKESELEINLKDAEKNCDMNSNKVTKNYNLKSLSKKDDIGNNGLKNSILRFGAFGRNTTNSPEKNFDLPPQIEKIPHCDNHSTHMNVRQSFENKSEAKSTNATTNFPDENQRKDFNFKKPNVFLGSRSTKSGQSVFSPNARGDTTREHTRTSNPVLTSSPIRMHTNLSLRNSPCAVERHSGSSDTNKDFHSKENDNARRINHVESPIISQKPLRERIENRRLEDHKNDVHITKDNQLDVGFIPHDEGSPIVRKKSKCRKLLNISSVSPLQVSPNVYNNKSMLDGESPIIRRRSKVKRKNGNVVAIAESDEEVENDIQIIQDEPSNQVKFKLNEQRYKNVTKVREFRDRRLVGASDSEEEFMIEHKQGEVFVSFILVFTIVETSKEGVGYARTLGLKVIMVDEGSTMGGFMESLVFDVKPSTCFAQKHTLNTDINPLDFLIVY
jgi:hypothetical protein